MHRLVPLLIAPLLLAWPVSDVDGAKRGRRPFIGRIVLTQKPLPPPNAGRRSANMPRRLERWLKKNGATALQARVGLTAGGPKGKRWRFHYYASLRYRPKRAMLYLVFYEKRGRAFKYINADYINVGTKRRLRGSYTLHEALEFKAGRSYQVRITLTDGYGNEIVYARSRLFTLR